MKTLFTAILVFLLTAGALLAGQNFDKLAMVLNPTYPIWKINNKATQEKSGFHLIFNTSDSSEIQIPSFKKVLNGESYMLLSCYGRIIPLAQYGYIVGTALEGQTFGKLVLFDDTFQRRSEIESQKVVKIMLVSLLGDETQQIITWEDHHYGTNTTRRVLNVYKVDDNGMIRNVFTHDLVDATFMPSGTDREIYYNIDYQSLIKGKQIVVTNRNNGYKEICTWNGTVYKGKNCQQEYPS